jgi:hypothetical protein
MAKAGWANQEMQRVAKEVKTLPGWVQKSAKATTVSAPQENPKTVRRQAA